MSLGLHRTVAEFRAACDGARRAGRRIGLVPTMGALHEGHLELVKAARRAADEVAVTIFVNPTQFGPGEDVERYPRDLRGDLDKCRLAGVNHVFAPPVKQMYPAGERTRVTVDGLSDALCGASRPGHFEGVATIVTKLLIIAGPCVAVFGKKDYQQLQVIQRLARDLMLPVQVIGHPIVRERDGLALSSRNLYLSPLERQQASAIPAALAAAVEEFEAGGRAALSLRKTATAVLESAGLKIDYVTLTNTTEVTPLPDQEPIGERALLAVAAYCGSTRLIDNVVLGEDPSPFAGIEAIG